MIAESEEQRIKRMDEEKKTKEAYNIYHFIINDGKPDDIDKMDVMLKDKIITNVDIKKPNIKNIYDSFEDDDKADNDHIGYTALMYQTLYGTYEAMEFLLNNNANPNIKSKDGCSLLQLLVSKGDYPEKVKLLLYHGAYTKATCFKQVWSYTDRTAIEKNMTPLTWLEHTWPTGRENTIRILKTHVEPPPYDGSDNPYGKGGARRNKSRRSRKSKKSKKSKKSRKSGKSRRSKKSRKSKKSKKSRN